MIVKKLFGLTIVSFYSILLFAYGYTSEIVISADRNSATGIESVFYYMQSEQDIDIETSSQQEANVLNLPTGVSTFSYTTTVLEKYELKKKAQAPVLKFSKRFGQKFHPYLKLGILKSELEGYDRNWESDSNGTLAGAGMKYVLLQDTVVTPAFAVNIGVNYENAEIKKLNMTDVNLKLKTTEIETSLWVSKKIKPFEVWAGFQLSWLNGSFEGTDVNGDSASVLFGLSYDFLKNIGITVELSLINLKDKNFCSGIKAGF
ncbi:MAG: hypothetical protein JW983_07360 [Elusimicrobia bacterium]|nr:hypothetical protein [Elusimicrobiota bacterium]